MANDHGREDQVRAEQARAVALFRYSLIREAADQRLSTKQRGRLVRELAAREHAGCCPSLILQMMLSFVLPTVLV